jgi:hypothetical protein
MNKVKKLFPFLSGFILMALPAVSFGAGLVPDCSPNCQWNDLLEMVNRVINFFLFSMVVPIAAIMFFYAGLLLVTSGGESSEAKTKAKSIFLNTVIGLVIAIAAWLIITTLLSILGYDGTWIGLKIGI